MDCQKWIDQIAGLNETISDQKKFILRREQEHDSEVTDLKAEIERLKGQPSTDCTAELEQISALRVERSEMVGQIRELNTMIADRDEQIAGYDEQLGNYKDEITRLNEEAAALHERIAELTKLAAGRRSTPVRRRS